MKLFKNIFLFILFTGILNVIHGQNFDIVNQVQLSSVPTKSYIVNTSGTLSNGFSVRASVNGPFFIRANKAADYNPNLSNSYTRTETLLTPATSESAISTFTISQKNTVYGYLDGLGRSSQNVTVQGSPLQQDMISFNVYDIAGRQSQEFLPYTVASSNSGGFRNNPVTEQTLFYYISTPTNGGNPSQSPPSSLVGVDIDPEPYKINNYTNTPFNQVKETYGPGADWHSSGANRSVKTNIRYNVSGEITKFDYNGSGLPVVNGTYPANILVITQAVDEESQIKEIARDSYGRTIRERVGKGSVWHDTYYVYDVIGNLVYVFPPEAISRIAEFTGGSTTVQQSFADRWTFQYQYDEEQRMTARRSPGSVEGVIGWTYIVYDQWNRVVLIQDAQQRTRNEYSFSKYDRLNRVIMTGLYTTTTALSTLRTSTLTSTSRFETEASSITGYTLTATFPSVVETNLLAVSYYDNYSFLSNAGWDAEANSYSYVNVSGYPQSSETLTSVKGYATGSKIRVLDQAQTKWLNVVTYYDVKYQPIQMIKENNLGGILRSTNKYDFVGKVIKDQQYNSFSSLTLENTYSYTNLGQLLTASQSINGATPVLLTSNKYNELGQLIEKNVHSVDNGVSFLQSIDYHYNIRGLRTKINNSSLTPESGDTNTDLFGMEFQFNPASVTSINNGSFTTKKLYDGNISAVKWKTDTKQGTPVEQTYGFDYDEFNRLKQAYYATNNSGVWNGNGGMFDEQIKSYDNNGNIKGILRNGMVQGSKTPIDDLTLTYTLNGNTGNRMITVDDANNNPLGFKAAATNLTEEYQYDYNGNLIYDFNKSISSITYNHLNLPKVVAFTRSDASVDQIEYTYDGLGNKLRKVVKIKNNIVWTTDYVGSAQYDNNQLTSFSVPEGRVKYNSVSYDYEYFLKDHLGNVRVAYGPLKATASYRATMESPVGSTLAADEEAVFSNVATTRSTPPDPTFNYTPASEKVQVPTRAAQCNGYTNKPIGPAKDLRVLNGDIVYMEAYAKYWNSPSNSSTVITNLVSVVNSSFTIPNPTDAATFSQQLSNNLPALSTAITTVANIPKAYLIWLFFDDSYVYQRSGAVAITTNAYRAFEKLNRSFTADKNGHLYIYVANESKESAAIDVYFDELYIVHQKTNVGLQVTQASDYYPFGLQFNKYCADQLTQTAPGVYATSLQNRYLFQGQELQKDLDLNLLDFQTRLYDPTLGRFNTGDNLAAKQPAYTPYNFTWDNPVNLVDVDGRFPSFPQPYINPNQYKSYQQIEQQQMNAMMPVSESQAWLSQYNAQWTRDYSDRVTQWGGRQASHQDDDSYMGGPGSFSQMFYDIVSPLIPITGIAKGLLDAREGNYGSAALNIGSSVLAFSPLLESVEYQTFYRTMSETEYSALTVNGGLSSKSGHELFVSTSEGYSRSYLGDRGYDILVEFRTKPGTLDAMSQIGVRDNSGLVGYSGFGYLPEVESGWMTGGFNYFKGEKGVLNVGLGYNPSVFNENIISFAPIE